MRNVSTLFAVILGFVMMLCAQSAHAQQPERVPIQDAKYTIQPEDVLSVVTRDVAEATGDFLVRKDGYITMPIVGEIKVVGLTVKELSDKLQKLMVKEVRDPNVTINVRSSSMQRVYAMGAIRGGGVLDWKPKWRITEVIAAAGGLAGQPERTKVLLFRPGVNHREILLKRVLVDGDDASNIEVQPGDVLSFQTDVTVRVQVVGQVVKPGLTEVLEGQGVAEVLAASGGALPDARLTGSKLVRAGKDIPIDLYTAVVKGNPSVNVAVKDGDTLYIPSMLMHVSVIGQVNRPGPVQPQDGKDMTLTQAISLAGGPMARAKTDNVSIVRLDAQKKPVAMFYDLQKLMKGTDKGSDPVLQDGDIVFISQSGRAGTGEITGILSLLLMPLRFLPVRY